MTDQPSLLDSADRVVEVDIADRMERSFLDYSMSVIVGRALPDARDGLKPVQRRILFAMWEAGLLPTRPHRKCAAAVGDVMKKYHPHGDSSIYEALVRMGQDFSTRALLIDKRGNFGTVDGDAPAAMRYTEARLSPIAMELLDGIDEDTVDFAPSYDGQESEPVVLPARVPQMLVNGATGIAVGMATNIPPHALGEVVDACRLLLAQPSADLDALMAVLPGPDFPTGARIVDTGAIRDVYATGRGAIVMEAVAATETRGGLPRIVITELPYQVNKSTLLERIADLVTKRRLESIRDLRDESSKEGIRVVLELKRGEDPAAVLGDLYRLTDLRTSFHANVVALVDGEPRTLGLREALAVYLRHQRVVLRRRTTFRRGKAAARAHILEGLLIALEAIDEVIALIRASATVEAARAGLQERFALTEVQATAILDMPLRRLAALERDRLAEELAGLRALLAELDAILADPARLDAVLDAELTATRERHADPRRTRIVPAGPPPSDADAGAARAPAAPAAVVLEAQPVLLTASAGRYLRAVGQRRTSAEHAWPRDPLVAAVRTRSDATLLLVDVDGGGYRVVIGDLEVATTRQRGTTLAQLTGDEAGADLAGAVVLGTVGSVVTVSASGLVKRTERAEYEGRTRAMVAAGVRDDDRIVAVVACDEADHLLVAHAGGLVLRFPVAEVRPMGRAAVGVVGVQVPAGAAVVAVSVLPGGRDEGEVLTLAADGTARRTPVGEYPAKGRGGKGLQTGTAALAWCGVATDLHVPVAEGWAVLRAEVVAPGRRAGRLGPGTLPVIGRVVPEVG